MFKRGVTEEDIVDEALESQSKRDKRPRRSAIIGASLPATEPTDITMAYLIKNKDSLYKIMKVLKKKYNMFTETC